MISISNDLRMQMCQEISASLYYLNVVAWFESRDYDGFAKFFRKQSAEEREHAIRIFDFLLEVGEEPCFGPAEIIHDIQAMEDIVSIAESVVELENVNTSSITQMADKASKANDHVCYSMLLWFVNEQVEEDRWANQFLTKVRICKDDIAALQMLNIEYGQK